MTCPSCGTTDLPESAAACPHCGVAVTPASPGVVVSPDLERVLRRDLAGQYEIAELLGRGGMSLVYLAHEVELSRSVAIKVLPLQFIQAPEAVQRFEREARIGAALDHPHIVPIYRVGTSGTFLWYTMKLVRGRTLSQMIAAQGPLPVDTVLAIVAQVGSALQYAHRHGVVHRDVKPANVMVEESGWALVCDFGVARAFGNVGLTQSGASLGTPRYMAPEQFDAGATDGRADQYSLAILTFEALTGSAPFTGDSLGELVKKHLLEPPPRVTDLRPDVAPHIANAIARALEKQPDLRYPDIAGFVDALGGSAAPRIPGGFPVRPSGTPLPPRPLPRPPSAPRRAPAPPPPPAPAPSRSRSRLALAIGVLLLAAAAAAGAWRERGWIARRVAAWRGDTVRSVPRAHPLRAAPPPVDTAAPAHSAR
ncbi:MAG TPA: serine/threonine-protein kinase [Gemmatimonadales bacterium]|nr:serine/threonine-protein kinase [Gemmatimonadales bacterium]